MMYCPSCRFYEGSVAPPHCRRFPPHPVSPAQVTYPFVMPRFWCGEHRFSLINWLRSWRKGEHT